MHGQNTQRTNIPFEVGFTIISPSCTENMKQKCINGGMNVEVYGITLNVKGTVCRKTYYKTYKKAPGPFRKLKLAIDPN